MGPLTGRTSRKARITSLLMPTAVLLALFLAVGCAVPPNQQQDDGNDKDDTEWLIPKPKAEGTTYETAPPPAVAVPSPLPDKGIPPVGGAVSASPVREEARDAGIMAQPVRVFEEEAKEAPAPETERSGMEFAVRKKAEEWSPAPPPASSAPLESSAVPRAKMSYAAPRPPSDPGKPAYEGFGEVFDEVWVIQKPDTPVATDGQPLPGGGELRAIVDDGSSQDGKKEVPLPLKHTEVKGRVDGYMASVTVSQKYGNPYDTKIEAVYVFPLPQNAAVSDFVMRIGERTIRGVIREREEAKRLYEEARNQGYVAALLQQERPNIFTQKVANIEPGRAIDVELLYFNTLDYSDGAYEFVFPMVVGPRFNPPGWKDGVGAVARGGRSGQPVDVSYLAPGERSGHDISLTLDIDAGVSIEEIRSVTHAVEVENQGAGRARVRIKPADTLPNKDFVLRYRVAGGQVKTALLMEETSSGGYFSLVLQPPRSPEDLSRAPKEMVFVLDCSGSMNGWPMELSKRAMTRALKSLGPDDTFQIIQFSISASALGPAPLPATPANIERALAYVARLNGEGGTMMINGIRAALDFPHDPRRLRVVSFMTDGYIGNEVEILREIHDRLGASRIFSFGIGSSVNRYLIDNMARVGRGAVAYITTNASPTEAVDRFYDVIGHPALTDVQVDWGGMKVSSVYPARIPDLFVGRPVILAGRFEGEPPSRLTVSGTVAGEKRSFTVDVVRAEGEKRQGISKIWARARIADLMNDIATLGHTRDREYEIRETALTHNLVSTYTSFVAVDAARRTEGDHGVTVQVPVPVPEGVLYETTVTQ